MIQKWWVKGSVIEGRKSIEQQNKYEKYTRKNRLFVAGRGLAVTSRAICTLMVVVHCRMWLLEPGALVNIGRSTSSGDSNENFWGGVAYHIFGIVVLELFLAYHSSL
jgi:hypothetical protein